MSTWLIHARDPMVVRDGRPKPPESEGGTLPFPYPGTLAGVIRTRAWSDATGRFTPRGPLDELRAVELRGPLLRDENGTLYVPRPRDALFVATSEGVEVRALRPLDEPGGVFDTALTTRPVGLEATRAVEGKPPKGLPSWWCWEDFARWLDAPIDGDAMVASGFTAGGLGSLPREHRVHVKIGATSTAEDGMLFETVGLRFLSANEGGSLRERLRARELGLACEVGVPQDVDASGLRNGVGPFAGERRLVRWSHEEAPLLPATPPAALLAHLRSGEPTVSVRVVLLTPAIFAAGWKPGEAEGQLLASRDGVKVTLDAAIVPRPETISGWDFAKNGPKATRRVVSSGSVFWLKLEGDGEARAKWAEGVWMQNVSDDAQDRRDGYGLAALGVG